MKENNQKILAVVLAIGVLIAISYLYITGLDKLTKIESQKNLNKKEWIEEHVKVKDSIYAKNVKEIEHNEDIVPFNMLYQEVVEEKIEKLCKNEYSIEEPLMIYNPYGTNRNSINIYFHTDDNLKLEYTIKVDDIEDFTRVLKNEGEDNLTTNHAYQMIGFIMGKKNKLILRLKNNEDEVVTTKEFNIDFTTNKSSVQTKLKMKSGESKEELSDGLYVMFGHDKAYNANNYLYDNNGVLRAELILENYRSDRIIFLNDEMIYSYKEDGFIRVNRLGKIEEEYSIGDYIMHHDYILDEENENLLILANKVGADTIEDRVISLSLVTGKVKEVIDMKDYLIELYDKAIKPEKNTYGGDELDWIHLNSLDIINGEDIVLSSRELSMIIYVKNIYRNPKIDYLITDSSVLEKTTYKDLNYQKDGDFVSQSGQHTITYQGKDDENQYYLYMYNNNYQGARTRPNFDWKNYPGTGTYQEGEESYYYKYLVDENEKTYKLVDKISLPYSSIVSSVEDSNNHYITSSGMSHCFNEYDSEGKMIKQFNYTSKKYAYRVFKYEFKNVWFL